MKRTAILLVFAFVLHFSSFATHIIGGNLGYTSKGNDVYEVTLTLYRDCFNGAVPFDTLAQVGVYDQNWNQIGLFDFNLPPDDTLNLQNTPLCFPPPVGFCVHRAVYQQDLVLPDIPGGYFILYQTCCRTSIISNFINPSILGSSYTCNVTNGNNSPVLKNALPYYSFVHKPFVYDASATDADGDDLRYHLVAAKGGGHFLSPPDPTQIYNETYAPGYDLAHLLGASPYPLTLDPQTGELKALPQTLGVFVVSFVIEEWRNGQKIGEYYNEIGVTVLDGNDALEVSGKVSLQNLTDQIDLADVQQIQRNPFTNDLSIEQTVPTAAAQYLFSDTYTSKYYARGLPAPNSAYYTTHWPTYHPDKLFWYEATEFEVCQISATDVDIELVMDTSNLAIGTGRITGQLVAQDQQPIASFELWLMDAGEKPVSWLTTDLNGMFTFDQLPDGQFQLYSNERNADIFNTVPPQIALVGGQQSIENQQFLVGASTIVPLNTSSTVDLAAPSHLEIVPSLAHQFISFKNLGDQYQVSYQILNMHGQVVQRGVGQPQILVSDLPKGMYFVRVSANQQRLNGKFVKM